MYVLVDNVMLGYHGQIALRLTAGVSCDGWEGGFAVETEKNLKPRKRLKKRAATHRQLHALLGAHEVTESNYF